MKKPDIKLHKKSQMKTFESVAVLIVFFILIALGLMFYAGVQKTSLKRTYAERTEQEAVKMAMKVSYLPELLCSKRKIIEDDCFDVHKLKSIADWVEFDEGIFLHYQSDFKESVITVKVVWPSFPEKTYILYENQPESGRIRDYYIIPTYVPVSLKDSTAEIEYSIGLLNVTMFISKV